MLTKNCKSHVRHEPKVSIKCFEPQVRNIVYIWLIFLESVQCMLEY